MLQHQIVQSPARLGLPNPNSPSISNLTPPKFPSSSSSSQSQQQQHHNHSLITSAALLPMLPPLPRAQTLLIHMASLASKIFDVSPNRSLWLSAFRGSLPSFLSSASNLTPPPLENPPPASSKEILSIFNSLQTQLFEAVTELQEILDLQDAKQKIAREVKIQDSALLEFANKLLQAETVLDSLVDDYADYRKPKRSKIIGDAEEDVEGSDTTISTRLKLKDVLSYAHRISYTTFAPPEFGAGQAPLRGALPPAPQDEQMRASQLYNFVDLDIGLPKAVLREEKKVEAIIEPPQHELTALQGLLPPNIVVPSGWKPGMPVELPTDLPMPPPGWKPGDPVTLPPLESLQVPPRIQEQLPFRPISAHRLPDAPIQVKPVNLDVDDASSSEYSSDDESSEDED